MHFLERKRFILYAKLTDWAPIDSKLSLVQAMA